MSSAPARARTVAASLSSVHMMPLGPKKEAAVRVAAYRAARGACGGGGSESLGLAAARLLAAGFSAAALRFFITPPRTRERARLRRPPERNVHRA